MPLQQEPVVTVWKGGEWKVWGAMDAFYAQADPDYLCTIPVREVVAAAGETAPALPCGLMLRMVAADLDAVLAAAPYRPPAAAHVEPEGDTPHVVEAGRP